MAIRANSLELVENLFEMGADFNICTKEGYSPFVLCCLLNLYELVQFMSEKVNINYDLRDRTGKTFFHDLVRNKKQKIFDVLKQNGTLAKVANISENQNGGTPLHYALYEDGYTEELIQDLITIGCDPNKVDGNGDTGLSII
jgi:ankyrin repeat protein